ERDEHLPKYIKIKNHIKDFIEKGKFKEGSKIPTEYELSREFNVSRHTVRKALNLVEQEGMLYKKQGVGTFVKKQDKQPTHNVGFISISLQDYIFADILHGVDEVFHESGYQILLGNSSDDQHKEQQVLREFLRKNVDGLIIEPAKSAYNYSNLGLLEKFLDKQIPVVILDSKFDNNLFNYVTIDDIKGGMLATDYLIDIGHRQIGIIYKTMHKPGLGRLEGYKRALRKHDIPIYNDYVKGYYISEFEDVDSFESEIYRLVRELMELDQPPTAIFCFNDQVAIRVKEILDEMGIEVPDKISLIGFDDSRLVKLNNISITSIAHPKQEAGRKAARIILENIEQGKSELNQNIEFRPRLIKRNSVKEIKEGV
ncbi:MAG: GntR family transcriptional regulator, partial [Bacillota bacterium]